MLIRGFNYGGGGGGGGGAGSNGPANAIQTSDGAGGFVGEGEFSYDPATNTVTLNSGTQVADNPALNISQTWNNGAVTFTGLKFNVTNTASAAASLVADLQIGGTSVLNVDRNGAVVAQSGFVNNGTDRKGFFFGATGANSYGLVRLAGGTAPFAVWMTNQAAFCVDSPSSVGVRDTAYYGWANGGLSASNTYDVRLYRDAANTLAQRNGTNAQTLRVYNTYADASNYERLALIPGAASGWMKIAAETAGTGTDNIGLALSPTGTGAISAHVPDSITAGGNARGARAVDLQMSRGLASQVASGDDSFCAGFANTVSGQYGAAVGASNTASGVGAFAAGRGNTASGIASIALGYTATTRGLLGAFAFNSDSVVLGNSQYMMQVQNAQTTDDATTVTLTATAAAADSANVMVLPNNSAAIVRVLLVARSSGGDAASWEIIGTFKRGANAAATSLVGSATITAHGIDAALSTVAVAVVANTTQGAPVVQVTGVAATTINWSCRMEIQQI